MRIFNNTSLIIYIGIIKYMYIIIIFVINVIKPIEWYESYDV